MNIIIRDKKGQSMVEYVILIILVLGALLATQNYFKRGLQGRWKASVDDLGDQYDPRVANSSITQTMQSNSFSRVYVVNEDAAGTLKHTFREDGAFSIEKKNGQMTVGGY